MNPNDHRRGTTGTVSGGDTTCGAFGTLAAGSEDLPGLG